MHFTYPYLCCFFFLLFILYLNISKIGRFCNMVGFSICSYHKNKFYELAIWNARTYCLKKYTTCFTIFLQCYFARFTYTCTRYIYLTFLCIVFMVCFMTNIGEYKLFSFTKLLSIRKKFCQVFYVFSLKLYCHLLNRVIEYTFFSLKILGQNHITVKLHFYIFQLFS